MSTATSREVGNDQATIKACRTETSSYAAELDKFVLHIVRALKDSSNGHLGKALEVIKLITKYTRQDKFRLYTVAV